MRRKALSSPEDSARLWMLVYCLKVHHIRLIACLDALKSTQAWLCLFLASRFRFPFCSRFLIARLFSTESHVNALVDMEGPQGSDDLVAQLPGPAPIDERGFVLSFALNEVEAARNFFDTYGFVVWRNVLDDTEIENTMGELFGGSGLLDPNDRQTWDDFYARQPFAFAGIIGARATVSIPELENRQNLNVHRAFSQTLRERDLIVDHDRLGCMRPTVESDGVTEHPEWRTKARWLHLDCNPIRGKAAIGSFVDSGKFVDFSRTLLTQGLLTLTDASEADGGFHCVPGGHKIAFEWSKRHDQCQLGNRDMQVQENDALMKHIQKIPIRKGSALIWSSLLFHGNHPNHSQNWRCVQYIRMFPRKGTPFSPLPIQDMFSPGFQLSVLGKRVFY